MKVSELFGTILTESKGQYWSFIEMDDKEHQKVTKDPDINAEVKTIVISSDGNINVFYKQAKNDKQTD